MRLRGLQVVKGPNAVALTYGDRTFILDRAGSIWALRETGTPGRAESDVARQGWCARYVAVRVLARYWG